MTRLADVIRGWFGWCPNTSSLPTAPVIRTAPSVTAEASVPGGGAGGSGRLDRGVSLALGSLRILFGNWQLLGFAVLTGLVFLFSLVSTFTLLYLSGIHPLAGPGIVTGSLPIVIAKGSPVWIILTFLNNYATVFCSTILLAGLISCVLHLLAGREATIRGGLTAAIPHLPPLAVWALIYATISTIVSIVTDRYPEGYLLIFTMTGVILLFGILMLFVVPVIVIEGKGLGGAMRESLFLIRKTWGEILAGLFVFIIIYAVAVFVSLMPAAAVAFPSGDQQFIGLAAALSLFVIMGVMMVYTTAVGIFLTGLYSSARTGSIPSLFEGKQAAAVSD